MDKETFLKIFNLLQKQGSTKPSQTGKSLVCYSLISDTSAIEALLPSGWIIKSNPPKWQPETQRMSPAMTTVFQEKSYSADEAFAAMDFS